MVIFRSLFGGRRPGSPARSDGRTEKDQDETDTHPQSERFMQDGYSK